MKSLIIVSVPEEVVLGCASDPDSLTSEWRRWTQVVKGIVVNGTPLFLVGNCERTERAKRAILGEAGSFTIPMCKWKMTDHIDWFATRFTGGTGLLFVHREYARAFMNDVSHDIVRREKIVNGCNESSDVFQLTLHKLGLLVSLKAIRPVSTEHVLET
jgi:hypothetical protein